MNYMDNTVDNMDMMELNHNPNHTENGLSPSEIITLERLTNLFYQYTNLPQETAHNIINVGYCLGWDNPEFVVFLMNYWVQWKDDILDSMSHLEGTPEYADEFAKRGFTFPEYKLVLSGKIKEQFYKEYRIFDFLYLTSQVEREYFTGINARKEGEVEQGYLAAIEDTIKNEIPILHSFLFETQLPINIKLSSLNTSAYLLAASGTGKSTIIKNIFYNLQYNSQIKKDQSLVLIEPHGDLCKEVVNFCLNRGNYKHRMIYLDSSIRDTAKLLFEREVFKQDYTFTINPFDIAPNSSEQEISYMTEELSAALFEVMESEATNQMTAVFDACVDVLLRKPDANILDLKRMMGSHNNDLLAYGMQSKNSVAADMMEQIKNDGKLKTTTGSIFYKLSALIGNSSFRRMLVGKSTVNLEREVNSGKIILFNLAKSKLGTKTSSAFGKLMMGLLMSIAVKRQDIPENKRMRTYCFVDEFQNYVAPTVAKIMEETRKYYFHLFLANQQIGQRMDKKIQESILSNTGLKFAGRNSVKSMETMASEMGNLSPQNFEKLPKFRFFMHNRNNEEQSAQLVRVPDFLVEQKSPFYMKKKQLLDVFKWLVYDSGYYKPVEEEKSPITLPNQALDNNIYAPNFEE